MGVGEDASRSPSCQIEIESGKATFESLEKYVLGKKKLNPNESGRQEMLENIINQFL